MTKDEIEIRVRSDSDASLFDQEFAELPARIRKDPYRVALQPAQLTLKMLSLAQLNPAAPSEFLLAYAGGGLIGRLGMNLDLSGSRGYVGFFEMDVTHPRAALASEHLLTHAETWIRSQAVHQMIGPVDLSTWFNYRFQVNKPSTQPAHGFFSWEPVNPPEYPEYFIRFGMKEIQAYHSQGFSAPGPEDYLPNFESVKKAHDHATRLGFRFRPLDLQQLQSREIPLLHELSHRGFQEAFLFEPISLPIFSALYAAALQRFDFSLSQIVETADGQAVGFLFAFIDADHVVVKTVAVLREYQNQKLSYALLHPMYEACHARGVVHGVSALIKSGAHSENHERRTEKSAEKVWRHDYALFGKDLP